MDKETGLYYYGARYLDSKYSMWISTDPALGEYIPKAPTNEEARRHNQNLPGMGGVFNHINGGLYHYAGNSPVRYIDPDGEAPFCVVTAAIGAGIGAAYGAYKSYSETGSVDWKEVGKDALIGGLAGLGLGGAAAAALTGSAAASAGTVAVAAKATAAVATATNEFVVVVEEASSYKLTRNLINSGDSRPMQAAAHHIVAGMDKLAQPARDILIRFGIPINDAANGVFLPANRNSINDIGASIHSTVHTIKYYETVNFMLRGCKTKQEVLKTLNLIKTMLLKGEF